jgi:exodeoxyribonuclease V alpha subunit
LRPHDPAAHFALRNRYVVLTPFRRGAIGTGRLGGAIVERLSALSGSASPITPIIVEENSRELQIFNGDFAMRIDDEVPKAVVQAEAGRFREIAAARLPRHSEAFALSIHKSQGSEFDEVLIVLPDEDGPLMTRELVYTAVSRAKRRVRIVGSKKVLHAALSRRARRDSGLVDAIAAATQGSLRDA